MPVFRSVVAKVIAQTMTAPMVAPIIGITSVIITTKASATAYSPIPMMKSSTRVDRPAQSATMNAPET